MKTNLNNVNLPEDLLKGCKQGESHAFKGLYNLYAKTLFSMSMRIVNDRDEAEDILQESFIKAFKDMGRFNTIPEFMAWIKRVVINHSIDSVRKRKFNFISIEDQEVADAEVEETDFDINTVIESIQQLPDGYRIILTLYLMEDYSHKEISKILGISESTSKSQYSRARRKLVSIINKKSLKHVTH